MCCNINMDISKGETTLKSLMFTIALAFGAFSLAGATPCAGKAENTKCPHATKTKSDCAAKCMKTANAKAEKTDKKAKCNRSPEAATSSSVATKAFMASYETKHCTKSATQAAYQAVLKATGCSHTANAAATEAARKFAYQETLERSSCSKTATAAADEAEKQASATLSTMSPQEAPPTAG